MAQSNDISCLISEQKTLHNCQFTITVPAHFTESFFKFATEYHQQVVNTVGFKKGSIPITYIEKHFKAPIISNLKELALKFFGFNVLLKNIREKKIILAGIPKLTDITFDKDGTTIYNFEAHTPKELYMQSWKFLPFKAVIRKKYHDIDKQVITFLEAEDALFKLYNPNNGIQVGDWICFQAWLVDNKNNRIFLGNHTSVWLRIGDEEPDLMMQKLFLKKQIGDTFITDLPCLQNYFCESSDNNYAYEITIKDIVQSTYFSLPLFKQYFKIKTQKDLQNKLIEVFSFHNDISQRRLMTFEALGLIMKKNQIVSPDGAINIQKKEILEGMQSKSDYMVYKMDNNFDLQITELAKKQLADAIIAESIAYQDNLSISDQDIKGLLHLTQRPRIKDFIYFPFIKSQVNGQEFPIEQETLNHFCLREKAVNHIIYHLTKK